jgi:GR25 family glycosyltransferase involved in LPS biosynthesis
MHTFVINLDVQPDRMNSMHRQLTQAQVAYERFPAVKGSEVLRDAFPISAHCLRFCTPGMMGCAASHMNVWRLVRERGLDMALVCEDDMIITDPDHFKQNLQRLVDAAPSDWDVILVGCFGSTCDPPEKSETLWHVMQRLSWRGQSYMEDVNDVLFRPHYFSGTHCYLVSAQGADKMATTLIMSGHVDHDMNKVAGLNIYAARQNLVIQASGGDSNIATARFPSVLNAILANCRDQKNIPWSYYMTAAGGQVFGASFNSWTWVCLVLGLTIPSTWFLFLSPLFLVDIGEREAWLGIVAVCMGRLIRRVFISV